MCYDTINDSISVQIVNTFTVWITNSCRPGQLTNHERYVSRHSDSRHLELMVME